MKFIDLSIPIINPNELVFDPPLTQPSITYTSHEELKYSIDLMKSLCKLKK